MNPEELIVRDDEEMYVRATVCNGFLDGVFTIEDEQDFMLGEDGWRVATHAIVERALLEEIIDALEKIYAKQITMNNHAHAPWLRKKIEKLRKVVEPDDE